MLIMCEFSSVFNHLFYMFTVNKNIFPLKNETCRRHAFYPWPPLHLLKTKLRLCGEIIGNIPPSTRLVFRDVTKKNLEFYSTSSTISTSSTTSTSFCALCTILEAKISTKAVVSRRWGSVRVCYCKFSNYSWHTTRCKSYISIGAYTEIGRIMPKLTDREILKRKRCKKDLDRIHSKILKAKKKLVRFFSRPREYPPDYPYDPRNRFLYYIRQFMGDNWLMTSFKRGKRIVSQIRYVSRYRNSQIPKDIHYTCTFIHIDRSISYSSPPSSFPRVVMRSA